MVIDPILFRVLGHIGWVNIIRLVNVVAEFPVVDFLSVSKVTVLASDQTEVSGAWWHQLQFVQNTQELVAAYMLTLGLIKIVEPRFKENTF